MNTFRLSMICFLLVLFGGCGDKRSGPPLASVAGKIVWNGKPLAECVVNLVPLGQTGGWGAHGRTNANGVYQLTEGKTGRPGVLAGTYRVVLSWRTMPDGSPVPADDKTPPMESPARESLPPEYSDKQKSKLQITIPAEGGAFDFTLPN